MDFEYAHGVVGASGSLALTNDADAIYPFASVTKLVAAYAMLVAVDRDHIGLDDPAGPATLRHVLAHASGLSFDAGPAVTEPGKRRIYSNYGIEVAGEAVANATGTRIQEWIEDVVLIPLGMSTTLIEGSPAYSGEGSVRDLLTFAQEVLSPTLVSETLIAEATRVQFPGLAGILPGYGTQRPNDWGLGFEIRAHKTPHWIHDSFPPHTIGHFGQSGSFLWIDRKARIAGTFLGEKPFSAEHKAMWPELTRQMRETALTS